MMSMMFAYCIVMRLFITTILQMSTFIIDSIDSVLFVLFIHSDCLFNNNNYQAQH